VVPLKLPTMPTCTLMGSTVPAASVAPSGSTVPAGINWPG
jgi:hypothetical protein